MTPLRQTMIQAMCQHGFSPPNPAQLSLRRHRAGPLLSAIARPAEG